MYRRCSPNIMPAGTFDGKIVHITQNDNTPHIPPPSPLFLTLHGSVARVLHLSGRGERLDNILRDYENLKVLREDGSSAEVLELALLMLELCCEEGVNINRKTSNEEEEEERNAKMWLMA